MEEKKFKLPEHPPLSDGMTTPAGYFELFAKKMEASLPANDAAEKGVVAEPVRRTWWQRSRPYIYMAAMFAGVWCMTKMFSLMKDNNAYSLEGNSVITAALSNNDFVDDYVMSSMNEYDILDELYESGIDIDN